MKKIGFAILFLLLIVTPFLYKKETKLHYFTNVKAPCPDFVGRQHYLDILYKNLLKEQDPIKIQVVWGKGGFGKTELAIQFANQYSSHFSLIWTFLCDSPEHIDQGYRDLAEKLGLSTSVKSSVKLRERVHFYLENHAFKLPWLLIFDNVEQDLTDYPQRGGAILVTSQKKVLNPKFILEIEPFSREESIHLLEKISEEKRSGAMEQLASDLDNIPLLINHAAHYIKATPSCDVFEYQKIFSSKLQDKEGPLWDAKDINHRYLKSLAASWQFSLKSLEKENPLALEWLFICSYLYPEHIHEKWLEEWLSEKCSSEKTNLQMRKKDIFRSLQRYGIIRYEENSKTFSLHRFFQHMIRESRKEHVQYDLGEALSLLAKNVRRYMFEDFSSWKEGEWWYLHACTVRKWLETYNVHFKAEEALFHEGIAEWCLFNDSYPEALESNYKVLQLRQSSGPSTELGLAYDNVGWTLLNLGRFSEALTACQEGIRIHAHFLEEKPLEFTRSLSTKGVALWQLGRYEESLECHHQSLKIRREKKGEIDVGVANSLINVSLCLRDQGNHLEALKLCDEAIEIYQRSCGKVHPSYINGLIYKAWIILAQGNYKKAFELFSKGIDYHISIRGKKQGDLSLGLSGMGWCYFHLKHYDKAKKTFKKALRNSVEHYGENTHSAIRAYRGLAWCYLKTRKEKKALNYFTLYLNNGHKTYEQAPRMFDILNDIQKAIEEYPALKYHLDSQGLINKFSN